MKIIKKRKAKGMTLAEIIVSLAVVSVMTLLLVTIGNSINTYLRSANNVNRKVSKQAPVAEVSYTYAARNIDNDVTIILDYEGNTVNIKGDAFSVEDSDKVKHVGDAGYRPGDALDIKFIRFKPEVTPPEDE